MLFLSGEPSYITEHVFQAFSEPLTCFFSYYRVAITFLLPHLLHSPETIWHRVKHRLPSLPSSTQGHNVLVQLKWNTALFYLPAKLCVCTKVYIFIAATSADGWNGGCHFAFQTSNAPPLIRCFHVLGLKKCCFFQWVTPMPTQLGTWAGDCQLQKRQQNLETRRWSPQALNFTKTEKRKRNHLPASACAAGTSSFCISISSLHGTWACTRWKMGHQPSPVRRCRANSLLSPESARQMLTR